MANAGPVRGGSRDKPVIITGEETESEDDSLPCVVPGVKRDSSGSSVGGGGKARAPPLHRRLGMRGRATTRSPSPDAQPRSQPPSPTTTTPQRGTAVSRPPSVAAARAAAGAISQEKRIINLLIRDYETMRGDLVAFYEDLGTLYSDLTLYADGIIEAHALLDTLNNVRGDYTDRIRHLTAFIERLRAKYNAAADP